MELTFLGLGAAFYPKLGNNCAMWKKEDTLYLFDCGSTAFSVLAENGALEGIRDIRVLVTHCHQDHVGSLATLISYCRYVTGQRVLIVHPDGRRIRELLALMGVKEEACGMGLTENGTLYRDEYIEASFVPVYHTGSLPAWGLDVFDGAERIYYSGDAEGAPGPQWEEFCAGRFARWYQDTALTEGAPPVGHGDYRAFARDCPGHLRERFYPMHWNRDLSGVIARDGFGRCRALLRLTELKPLSARPLAAGETRK